MIDVQITDNAAFILGKLKSFPQAMATSVAQALDQENELTIGQIQLRKLSHSGPTTLGVRSARLWKSIVRTRAYVSGGAIVSAIGSNVVYAGVHEFGFDGDVTVRAYVRRARARLGAIAFAAHAFPGARLHPQHDRGAQGELLQQHQPGDCQRLERRKLIMAYLSFLTVLDALKTRLASLPLDPADASADPDKLFERVEYYGANDLPQALMDLLVIQQRVCVIVPASWDHQNERDRVMFKSVRTIHLDLYIADRAMTLRDQAALVGGAKNLGILAMADRVVTNLAGTIFATPNFVVEPTLGTPVVISSAEKKNLPGREAFLQAVTILAGMIRATVP